VSRCERARNLGKGFLDSSSFKKYLLPGFIFQSVVIGGGYGTGRELVEYFLNFGPLGGLLGMLLVTTVTWSILLAVTFEFSRMFRAYDYRTFFRKLVGPLWILFEIFYFIFLMIVLGVIASAAGIMFHGSLGIPHLAGVFIMLASIGFLTFKGSRLIEKFLSRWSVVLYVVYGLFLMVAIIKFGPQIKANFTTAAILPEWALGGFKCALYNMGIIPTVLFCITHIETRKEALSAGLIGGVLGIIPGVLFFVATVGFYPAVLSEKIPAVFVLQRLGLPLLYVLFHVVLFGTLIETGTGFIHAVNERIKSTLLAKGQEFHSWMRPLIALGLLLAGLGLSTFGIIDLVAKGYGSISWGFFIIYIVPLLTFGIYRILIGRHSVKARIKKEI